MGRLLSLNGGADARLDRCGMKAHEHRAVGDAATGAALVNLGGDTPDERFLLTHGDVVALSGDFFMPDSAEADRWRRARGGGVLGTADLFELAKVPGGQGQRVDSRDEIISALRVMTLDEEFEDPRVSPGGHLHTPGLGSPKDRSAVETVVRERFLALAAANGDHFVSPWGSETPTDPDRHRASRFGSAPQAYRTLHERALDLACRLGATGGDITKALAREAAAQHYLTDSFASGHLRTPVAAIRRFWHQRYPGFWESLQHEMAGGSVSGLEQILPAVRAVPSGLLRKRALAAVRASTRRYPPISLGDLLARVYHDWDNWQGLVLDGGETLYGDGRLDRGPGLDLAVAAVKLGNEDVDVAYHFGVSSRALSGEALFEAVRSATAAPAGRFRAEANIPVIAADNPAQNWKANDLQSLWIRPIVGDRGATVGEALSEVVSPGGEVLRRLDCLGHGLVQIAGISSLPLWRGLLSGKACEAFHRGVIERLGREPRASLMAIVRGAAQFSEETSFDDWLARW
ncbi:MAG: hypothetical protein ABR564_04800 [Candidatus Dormibacteria bacterium]